MPAWENVHCLDKPAEVPEALCPCGMSTASAGASRPVIAFAPKRSAGALQLARVECQRSKQPSLANRLRHRCGGTALSGISGRVLCIGLSICTRREKTWPASKRASADARGLWIADRQVGRDLWNPFVGACYAQWAFGKQKLFWIDQVDINIEWSILHTVEVEIPATDGHVPTAGEATAPAACC